LAVTGGTSDWLRLPAAAALAGVSPAVLRRRADAGELPCFRRGSGPRYFRTRDLAAWREAGPEQGAPLVFDRQSTTGPDGLREGLYDLILRLSPAFDLREAVDLLASGLRELVDAADCDIWMPEGERLRCVACCDVQGFDRAAAGKILPVDRFPLTRRSLESTQPLAVDSLADETLTEAERDAMRGWGLASLLDIPMVLGGNLVGLIELYDIVPRDFSGLSAAFESSGHVLAGAFAKAALLDRLEQSNSELRHQNRRLSSLLDAGRAITSTLVVEDVLDTLARKSAEAVGSPECLIYEFDLAEGVMTVRSDYCAAGSGIAPYADGEVRFRTADYPMDARILLGGVPVQEQLGDPDLDPASRRSMETWGEKSVLNVPFSFGDEPLGLLVIVETQAERRFTTEEIQLVCGIGEQAAAALHNAKVYRELEQRQREAELLNEIARKITSSLRVEEIAEATVAGLRRLVPFDRSSLVLADERGMLTNVLTPDGDQRYRGLEAGELAPGLAERLRHEQVLALDLPAQAPLPAGDPVVGGLRSGAVAGLLVDDQLIGALSLGSVQPRAYSGDHLRVLRRVATHLALALSNARLYDSIRRLHLSNLKALSSALSAKDYYTLGHAARVAAYMVLLGKELGWPHETLVQAEEAAYLHDIGKIAISDRVLLKPSRLNSREWELMRQHPSFSADIIGALFAPELVAAVRHHHERYDGGGYPDGLAGDDIPALAQAMCIVDSYDAMSSWRPYRGAMTYADCLLELERCRGSQFDPHLVDAFRRVLGALADVHRRAGEIARRAARRIDVAQHSRIVAAGTGDADDDVTGGADGNVTAGADGDIAGDDYRAVASILRDVRDANPPARFLTTIVGGADGLIIAVDGEEEAAQHSSFGEPVLVDDELQAVFAGRQLDINVVLVDEWGAWVSGIAPLRNEAGRIVAVVNADLPADVSIRLEGLRGNLSETFASLVHSAALRFSRAEVDAITDGLTGVYNHRHLHERLAEEVESAAERGADLTLLFLDLDHFKEFNDRHGHSAGDTALRGVAQIIESSIRHVDVAARYGGEEFAVILVDTDAAAGRRIAERIRRRIAGDRHAGAGRLSISIGMATFPADADSAEAALERADAAMYEAKRLGRDRVVAHAAQG
jgi:diguanylate cyclase (GGDEF)-like protein